MVCTDVNNVHENVLNKKNNSEKKYCTSIEWLMKKFDFRSFCNDIPLYQALVLLY